MMWYLLNSVNVYIDSVKKIYLYTCRAYIKGMSQGDKDIYKVGVGVGLKTEV